MKDALIDVKAKLSPQLLKYLEWQPPQGSRGFTVGLFAKSTKWPNPSYPHNNGPEATRKALYDYYCQIFAGPNHKSFILILTQISH
jgi:hypothetical protein